MSYLIPLLVIYSLFYTHVNYAAQSIITLRFPCSNSGIENPEKMMQENKEAVKAVLMRLKKTPGAVYIAGVDYYAETHTGSERDETKGTGVLTHRSTDTLTIMGNVVGHLASDLKNDSMMHLVSHCYYHRSQVLSSWQRYHSKSEIPQMPLPYIPSHIREVDTLIYVIGQDLPEIEPGCKHIKMDAFWHVSKIKELKSKCCSMIILIAQGRYQEFAPTIIKECGAELIDGSNASDLRTDEQSTNDGTHISESFNGETITASSKSYHPLFIFSLGLAALACGVFYYKYFINGSASNS